MSDDFEDHCWRDLVDDEILEIYQSYRRETSIGPNPALLVIDLYNRAYGGGPGPVAEANRRSPGGCGPPGTWCWPCPLWLPAWPMPGRGS